MMSTGMPIKDMKNIVYDIFPEGLDRQTVTAVCNALYAAGYRPTKEVLIRIKDQIYRARHLRADATDNIICAVIDRVAAEYDMDIFE